MIVYPLVDINEWIKDHKLELDPSPCVKCKKLFPFEIAVASKQFRGVQQKEHECGKEYVQSLVVPIGKELDEWKIILGI